MKPTQSPAPQMHGAAHPRAEGLLFGLASFAGVYALGQGLAPFYSNTAWNQQALLWLAVAGVALVVLAAQMGRVQDSWPKRKASAVHIPTDTRKERAS